jgi:methylated-DNA-[protein]-cysteine S-methyltransferase
MRAVGQAMAKNPLPLVVPCHRVIADHARLGGYTGGTDRKRALLALEGVEVDGDTVRPGQLELLDRVARPR